MMRKLLEAMTKFANPEQKPGEQWKGTDKGTPGNKLVGSADESVLKDLSKGQTPKTKEQELAEEWANFNEDDLGVEEKRPHRTGSRADKVGVRGHKEQPRYTTVKDEDLTEYKVQVDNFTADDIKELEGIKDLATLKARAFQLVSTPSKRPMKPEKVAWFKQAIDSKTSPLAIIKLMWDLLLSGEGQQVIGSRNSMSANSYRGRFDEATAAGLKVGDHVTANTSKGEYPGGHKSRAGKVTRVGQTGVHIRPDDGGAVEYHPYKIVKKTVDEAGIPSTSIRDKRDGKKQLQVNAIFDDGTHLTDLFIIDKDVEANEYAQLQSFVKQRARELGKTGKIVKIQYKPWPALSSGSYNGTASVGRLAEGWNTGSDRVHLSDKSSAYWGGTGRLQAEYDALYKQLVPSQGAADTIEGEVIRASSKIIYRHYNDGDEFNQASFDQLTPYIGTVTSYDDLAEKAIEFALKANGNYHPNTGWDSLDVMDYGPEEEEEYDDEEDDEEDDEDDTNWDEEEDNLEEGEHDAEFIDHEDNWYNMADWARAEFNKGKSVEEVIKYLRDNDYLGPQDTNNFMKTVRGEKWNESVEEGKHFKTAYGWAGGRNEKTGKMYKHPDQIKADREANKMAQAQAQIDADREKERDRFSQEELYPSDDSHDLDEAAYDPTMGYSGSKWNYTPSKIERQKEKRVPLRTFQELCDMLGISRHAMANIAKKVSDFPKPIPGIGGKKTYYDPQKFIQWAKQNDIKKYLPNQSNAEVAEGWGADTQKAESDRSTAAWDTLRAKYANDPAVIKRLNYLERMNWTAAAAEKKANAGEIKGVAESKADTTGSWVVHSGSKVKKFKTREGAKAYAEKNGGKVASSEFYADKVQKDINEDVSSTDPLEGALLNAIQELVSQGHKDVDPMVLTNMVVAATSRPFLLKDLVDANNNSLAVQHYIDSISPSKVKFSTDTLTVKNEDPSKDKAKSQAGVSSMASRAANRSRLGENSVTPLRDKDDYKAKRAELQRIQLDPSTAQDPQLRDEVIRRLHSLNQQYSMLREQITKFKESRGHKAIATKLGNIDRMQNVQIPSPAERREQLRIAKAKEEVGKKQVKEFAAPGANPAPVTNATKPVVDPAAAQKVATATSTIKSATGSTVAAPVLATALDAASQGQANPSQVKAIAPIANVVDSAAKDPKLAGQFKTLAMQAQQSLKAQQKPQ